MIKFHDKQASENRVKSSNRIIAFKYAKFQLSILCC